MPCIYPLCGQAANAGTGTWNVGQLCDVHYATVAAKYAGIPNVPLVSDFVKVHILLQYNTAACLAETAKLNNQMTVASGIAPPADPRFAKQAPLGPNYLKLSRALEYYEGYCWFPANRALLGGLLSSDAFNVSLKYGMNKDPGAGRAHGEQSHRLQWHVIMRLVTNDFQVPIHLGADWHHSALELFHLYTQGAGAAIGAWGIAMDAQANQGWGNPDNVVKDVLASGQAMLSDAMTRRIAKMGGPDPLAPGPAQFSARDQAIMNAVLGPPSLVPPGANATKFIDELILQIYTWEKQGFPTFRTSPLEKAAKQAYDAAKLANPALFATDKTYKEKKKNLLVKKDAPDDGVKIDASRVARSRNGFNVQYLYAPNVGASPAANNRY